MKVFDAPSSFAISHTGEQIANDILLLLNFESLILRQVRLNDLLSLGSLKRLQAQEARSGFMFDGKEVIGGNFFCRRRRNMTLRDRTAVNNSEKPQRY